MCLSARLCNLRQSDFKPRHYQIVSGHHRAAAAKQAGLAEVPAWVREMDDEAAYMALVTSNAQSELSALERGIHALYSGMDVKAYAGSVGRKRHLIQDEVQAARVAEAVSNVTHDQKLYQHLVEIHAAPRWLWPALVDSKPNRVFIKIIFDRLEETQ